MKCVRIVGQGVPLRLTDDTAFDVVHRQGDGEYCSKSFFESWYEGKPEARKRATDYTGKRLMQSK